MLWLGTVMILNSNNKSVLKRYVDDKRKEADPKGWSTVLVTALGSWEKTVPCDHVDQSGDATCQFLTRVMLSRPHKWYEPIILLSDDDVI
jgi:hypothetical protein